jgi:hypothetical protein
MRVRVLTAIALCTVVLGGWFAAGCSDTAAARSVLRVNSINDNRPLQSDVVGGTAVSPIVFEDAIVVSMSNTPHDAALNLAAGKPFGYVTLDRYEIRFEGPELIAPVTGSLGWTVETGQTVTGSLIAVPASLKVAPPLVALRQGGEFQVTARLTIIGHEADSERVVKVEASFPVNFANWSN